MKIVVLMGGTSSEREVSLRSGAGVARALKSLGHEVVPLDTAAGEQSLDRTLRTIPPSADLIFIALHGGDGENGTLQALLDLAGIPYTGSGLLASALAMDKAMSKRIFRFEGIPTPEWIECWAPEDPMARWEPEISDKELQLLGGYPLIVKPNEEGSSVGITVVERASDLRAAMEGARRYGRLVLVETFIEGSELTVGVIDGRALPVVEVIPDGGWYDYKHKYTAGASRYDVPADIAAEISERLLALSLHACRVLRCRGVARVDFRLGAGGAPYCLEVNTVPGLTELSLVPKAAAAAGMSYEELIRAVVESVPLRAAR